MGRVLTFGRTAASLAVGATSTAATATGLPVVTIVSSLLKEIRDACDAAQELNSNFSKLREKACLLLAALIDFEHELETGPEHAHRVKTMEEFVDQLRLVHNHATRWAAKPWWKHIFNASRADAQLGKCTQQLSTAHESFTMKTAVQTAYVVDTIHVKIDAMDQKLDIMDARLRDVVRRVQNEGPVPSEGLEGVRNSEVREIARSGPEQARQLMRSVEESYERVLEQTAPERRAHLQRIMNVLRANGVPSTGLPFLDGQLSGLEDVALYDEAPVRVPGAPEVGHSLGGAENEQFHIRPRKLRRGYYGERYVVVRRIRDPLQGDKALRRFKEMMRICDQLDHKNIQKLCGLVTDPAGDNLIFMSTVAPYTPYTISQFISQEENAGFNRMRLLLGVAEGMRHLHDEGLVHGCLQAKRIRVDQYNVPKLVDFGISAIVQDCIVGELDTTYFLYKRIRERWAAPEQLICPRDSDRKARPSAETDTFVFGLVVMEVLTNYVPYPWLPDDPGKLRRWAKDCRDLYRRVDYRAQMPGGTNYERAAKRFDSPEVGPLLERAEPWLTEDLWALVDGCLKVVPAQRLKMPQVVKRLQALADAADIRLEDEIELKMKQVT